MNRFHLQEAIAQKEMTWIHNNNNNKLGIKFKKTIQQSLKKFILNRRQGMLKLKIN